MEVRYFLAKCRSLEDLKRAITDCEWAVKERVERNQPLLQLQQLWTAETQVVLIFSVTGQRGYHGVAHATEPPHPADEQGWHRFSIRWRHCFWPKCGEQCLSFAETSLLTTVTGEPVNQARNFDEILTSHGARLTEMINDRYTEIVKRIEDKAQKQKQKAPPVFLDTTQLAEAPSQQLWHALEQQVEQRLGTIVCSCPFGSRRYNLHEEDSDEDMLVVYRASTSALLGFKPPPTTLKSRECEPVDYHVLELHRFCELLLAGDPKQVEVLFLPEADSEVPGGVRQTSAELLELRAMRDCFLTRQLVDKYLRDACGAKGLRFVDRLMAPLTSEERQTAAGSGLPQLRKVLYVCLRLLLNARQLVCGEPLCVWRSSGSDEHKLLMHTRKGLISVDELRQRAARLEEDCRTMLETCSLPLSVNEHVTQKVESWLVGVRHQHFYSTASFECAP